GAYTQASNTSAQTSNTSAQTSGAYTQASNTSAQTSNASAQTSNAYIQASGTYSNSAVASSSSGTYSGLSGASFTPGDYVDPKLLILSGPPNIIITYNHGKAIPVDYLTLRNKAISILSTDYIYKSGYDMSKLQSIFYTNYQLMPKGNYPLKFYYNYGGCLDVDADTPMISKPFIY
ncbi:MAG: hypothetical protein K8R31_05700, partial [Bacteroidales bacterium]|nr:hypothetical protein [Bacteroidales bacterium]